MFTRKVGKWAAMLFACVIVALGCNTLTSSSAHATGYQLSLSVYNAQVEESVLLSSIDTCPNDGLSQTVRGTLVDSSSSSFAVEVTTSRTDGYWQYGILSIPLGTATGTATLSLECFDGASVTRTYEDRSLAIVANSTQMVSEDIRLWNNGWLKASTPCPGNDSEVVFSMRSKETKAVTSTGSRYPSSGWSDSRFAPTDFYWEFEIYTEPVSIPAGVYFVHVYCVDYETSARFDYDSYRLEVEDPDYVALGDSYSSGEGTYNYDIDFGLCHRSSESYAYYVAEELSLGTPNMKACSGAVTDDFFASGTHMKQVGYLSSSTQKVTLTIGGNDVGFGEVLDYCAKRAGTTGWGCSSDPYLSNAVIDRLDALVDPNSPHTIGGRDIHTILEVLEEIHAYAPNAEIYIGGYPHLFGSSTSNYDVAMSAPGGYECAALPSSFAYNDTQWMNGLADDLNQVISDAVDAAQLQGIDATYVSPALFSGHGQCDTNAPYINWIDFSTATWQPLPESFHPSSDGHWLGYGLMFESAMN